MKEMIKEMARNMKTYYFMAGLPRSGSTMLSAILNQNPQIHSGPSSPVTGLMMAIEQMLLQDELFKAYPKPESARKIIASIIDNFYSDVDRPVVIDKNRSWVNRPEYISGYLDQQPKIICPVRNIDEILTSFIMLQRRNGYVSESGRINFIDEMLVKSNIPLTDDNRCEFIASPNGILGQSYHGLRDALIKGHARYLHFVEYSDLILDPQGTMKKLYEFLELPEFQHDFSNLKNLHEEKDDEIYGLKDMHHVRAAVANTAPRPQDILSEATLNKCKGAEFWRDLSTFEENVNQEENQNGNNDTTTS
jgi:sulfotransferase